MTASRSRWFVGSSSRRMSGSQNSILARAILILQPPESFRLGLVWASLLKPSLSSKTEALATCSVNPISYSQFWTFWSSERFSYLIRASCWARRICRSPSVSRTSSKGDFSLGIISYSIMSIWGSLFIPSISFLARAYRRVVFPIPFSPMSP